MAERALRVDLPDGGSVTAIETGRAGDAGWTFLYAPGVGSNVHDPFGAYACRRLAERGIRSIRFQFPYMEAGRRAPDRPPVLESAWRAVIEQMREDGRRLLVGGRSMGGRIASQVAAAGTPVDALALFAYPLHSPGRPEQLRTAHLAHIRVPTLFCSGTNDAFATPDELREAAALVPGARVHLLEGADHGFAVPKASGRTREAVREEAVSALLGWLPRWK